ncbi:MAG: hypothetical protein WCK65_12115 [Rhodospirillaceae bacterium]
MTYLDGEIVTTAGTHRLHDRLFSLTVGVQCAVFSSMLIRSNSIDWYRQFLVNDRTNVNDSVKIESTQFQKDVLFPLRGPMENIVLGQRPQRIAIRINPYTPMPAHAWQMAGINPMFDIVIAPIFVELFECHRPWINNQSGAVKNWPPFFNFCRAVRNALSHGGKLDVRDSTTGIWHHLTYSDANIDHPVFGIVGADLAFADLVILMFEFSHELDRLSCPNF